MAKNLSEIQENISLKEFQEQIWIPWISLQWKILPVAPCGRLSVPVVPLIWGTGSQAQPYRQTNILKKGKLSNFSVKEIFLKKIPPKKLLKKAP